MSERELSFQERRAYGALSCGHADGALEAAALVDAECQEPYVPPLAVRMRRALEKPDADGWGCGISEKQFDLLSALVVEGNVGIAARDLEPYIARGVGRGYIGWSKEELTTTLERLMKRGLVRREERPRVRLRDPKWVWYATDEGVALTMRYLDEKGY